MTLRLPLAVLALSWLLTTAALAQLSITPPTRGEKEQVKKAAEKARPKPPAAKRPEAKPEAMPPTATATPTPSPTADNPNVDLVYGAYQRGYYKTSFNLALPRAQAGDIHAMTMLGELYANGLGVKRDYAKAAEWYKKASDGGDREAMLALAMMRLGGFGATADKQEADRQEAVKLLASAAKLGEAKAAYNLALLYLDGQTLPRDVKRSAELLRQAADAGNPEAQYALATFYKEGNGVPKDMEKAVRLLQAAALADNVDAEVEYAIALFNGTGTPRNQTAAIALLRKAARQGSPIAQNRLAYVLVNGMGGVPVDKIEGLKWHLIAKTAGKYDPDLDIELSKLSPADRAETERRAHRWLGDQLDAPALAGQPHRIAPAVPDLVSPGAVPGIPEVPTRPAANR